MTRLAGGAPSLADVILAGIEDRLREFNTACPGEVIEYDPERQTATVRPMVAGFVPDDENALILEYPPDIYDVPVIFNRSLGGGMTLPFGRGDSVQLLYNQRDIGQWRATNVRGSPGDHRINSMSGAVAIPGLYADANKLSLHDATNLVLYVLGDALVKLGGATASEFIALSTKLDLVINAFVAPTLAGTLADAATLQNAVRAVWTLGDSCAATKVQAL